MGLDAGHAIIQFLDGLDDSVVDPDDFAGIADLVEFEEALVEERDARIFQLREERINLGLADLGLVVDKRHMLIGLLLMNETGAVCDR